MRVSARRIFFGRAFCDSLKRIAFNEGTLVTDVITVPVVVVVVVDIILFN